MVDDRRAGRARSAVHGRRVLRGAALPRSACCRCRRCTRVLHALRDAAASCVSVALGAGRPRRSGRFYSRHRRARRAGATRLRRPAPRRCRASTSSTSCTRRCLGRPIRSDLRSRSSCASATGCCSTERCTAWPRIGARRRPVCSRACRPAACISTRGSFSSASPAALLWSWGHV